MFLAAARRTPVDLEDWAVQMMERHNRKSHLAPQLSPSTRALLRGEEIPSPKEAPASAASTATKTPTSGMIPIAEDDRRAMPTGEQSGAQRVYSNDVNGTGMYPSQSAIFDRSGFPPRTSSNISAPSSGRLRDGDSFSPKRGLPSHPRDSGNFNSTTLPIRPAPPPLGPLPAPPDPSLRNSATKRSVPNGSPYSYSDNQQH